MSVPPIPARPERQPIFNLPLVVILLLAGMAAIHFVRAVLLTEDQGIWVLVNFAFIPDRSLLSLSGIDTVPGAAAWTFVTYAFLHGSIAHLVLNGIWLAAFGSPLAWRFGAVRFLAFSGIAAVAGAAVHLALHSGETVPLVGASAAISAHMAGAARFLFLRPMGGVAGVERYRAPSAPLSAVFTDRRTVTFLGASFAINLVVGLTSFGGGDDASGIAWEAHIGGFAVGLFLFPFFDPVRRERVL